ncbi:CaiB/BaiF CoA transferase family protein [Streptomyces alkaliphilus]|uniref:CaiB/BaiF CoA transferase family protein n=1 Tax=Streptomyces alkaliphilus TaxID=1472722 RepID=UPI00117E9054|nr:CaiB/BaiF CoA-transferase family protein [Streptomyces alkaliphilus]MQS08197.1 CoA transferase [Streptomyces alkaliphilus]
MDTGTGGGTTADAVPGTDAPQPAGGPLAGLRVVELAGIGPGPFAAMILGDLGADVVRVDRPGSGWPHIDPRWDTTNRNKRSVLLDLKREGAAERVLDLVERADVLLEGYRPGVAERLGVGPDACLTRNPRLVYGRMTGWGQEGPLAHRAGHDIDYIAITGALGVIGPADGRPAVPANLLGDYAGGSLYLAVGVLAALHRVRAGGAGQVVDAAIVDGTAHLTTMLHGMMAAGAWQDRREANLLDGGTPWYDTYAAADGRHLAIGPLEPRFWEEFLGLVGLAGDPTLPDREDPGRRSELRAAIAARIAERTREEWMEVFAGTEACVAPVLSLREAPHHPHLAARGTFVEHDGLVQPAPAPRFSATPGTVRRGPARPGADVVAVARDWGVPGLAEFCGSEPLPAPGAPDSPGA